MFTAAAGAVPQLADWVDPRRSTPITDVLPAGRIHNRYRAQTDHTGRASTPGLVSVGDAVCTTTPLAGRSVTLALMQARRLLRLIGTHRDIDDVTTEFDVWCTADIRPWFDDHCHADADRERRWAGGDVDVTQKLPSDLIVAAATVAPEIAEATIPFATMDALPASLESVEPIARARFARGWRPALPHGPPRNELAEICARAEEASPPTSQRVTA